MKLMNELETEVAIAALHSSGDYLVLRRVNLDTDPRFTRKPVPGAKIGLCLDTETTGLDSSRDKVIEIGIVAFEYDPDNGKIINIIDRYSGFEDPGFPLPKEIKEVTGITDEMVADQEFDVDCVRQLAEKTSLVVAHNAGFDRRFVERRFPEFARVPWACTVNQVNWQAERISSRTLEYLLIKCGGYCINAHRALEDAEGLLGLLLCNLPISSTTVFASLLEKAFETTSKIIAVGSPFETKDILKQRGYRWSDGSKGPKAWWTVVPEDQEKYELSFLAQEIYPGGNTRYVEIKRIDALSRFSSREE